MFKKILISVVLFAAIMATGFFYFSTRNSDPEAKDKKEITEQVTDFGKQLQKVNLLESRTKVGLSLTNNYTPYITQELLASWIYDPTKAPGRTVSSPWPDSIVIDSISKIGPDAYKVNAKVLFKTSKEMTSGGSSHQEPVTLTLKKAGVIWLITKFENILVSEPPVSNTSSSPSTLKQQLGQCLPLSDMASKQKCDSLIATITNYDQCLEAGFTIESTTPPTCRLPDGRTMTSTVPTTITVSGLYVCLPVRDITKPHNDLCALGLMTDQGIYYAMDSSGVKSVLFPTGDQIKVTGLMVPVEQLSSLTWQSYNIVGVIKVTEVSEVE
jgi:hypothetical protein